MVKKMKKKNIPAEVAVTGIEPYDGKGGALEVGARAVRGLETRLWASEGCGGPT